MSSDVLDRPQLQQEFTVMHLDDLGDRPLMPGDVVTGLGSPDDLKILEGWVIDQIDPDARPHNLSTFKDPLVHGLRQGFQGEVRDLLAVVVPVVENKLPKTMKNKMALIESGRIVTLVLDGIAYTSGRGVIGSLSRSALYRPRSDDASIGDTVSRDLGPSLKLQEASECDTNPLVRAERISSMLMALCVSKKSAKTM